MELPNPSRKTIFQGTSRDMEILMFSVQPTTSRIGDLTRLILTLVICDVPYIHTVEHAGASNATSSRTTTSAAIADNVIMEAHAKPTSNPLPVSKSGTLPFLTYSATVQNITPANG